jgi:hypothetical protein
LLFFDQKYSGHHVQVTDDHFILLDSSSRQLFDQN